MAGACNLKRSLASLFLLQILGAAGRDVIGWVGCEWAGTPGAVGRDVAETGVM